jgi:hypothetical protein
MYSAVYRRSISTCADISQVICLFMSWAASSTFCTRQPCCQGIPPKCLDMTPGRHNLLLSPAKQTFNEKLRQSVCMSSGFIFWWHLFLRVVSNDHVMFLNQSAWYFFFFSVPVCAITASGMPGGTLISMNSFRTLCGWLVQRQGWRVNGWMWSSEQARSAKANSWLDYQRPLEK